MLIRDCTFIYYICHCQVFSLDLGRLVAGTTWRGELTDRLTKVIDEVKSSEGKIVLFIDELHALIGDSYDGPVNASNILKPALARGELKVIQYLFICFLLVNLLCKTM